MGSFAIVLRGVRDGFVRDLEHPDRPRLAAMTAHPHGASCAWCSIAGQPCCCRATSIARLEFR